jgi:hypothetical protein
LSCRGKNICQSFYAIFSSFLKMPYFSFQMPSFGTLEMVIGHPAWPIRIGLLMGIKILESRERQCYTSTDTPRKPTSAVKERKWGNNLY